MSSIQQSLLNGLLYSTLQRLDLLFPVQHNCMSNYKLTKFINKNSKINIFICIYHTRTMRTRILQYETFLVDKANRFTFYF